MLNQMYWIIALSVAVILLLVLIVLGLFTARAYISKKNRELASKNKILGSLADIYYSIHIFDLKTGENERIVESSNLKSLIGNITDSQQMINTVLNGVVCEEYLSQLLEFGDLKTLPERMGDKSHIISEFIGKNYGWIRMCFICVENEGQNPSKVMLTTQIIDAEKKEEIKLLFQSNNDELTDLYNRRAYDKEFLEIQENGLADNLIYVSMDLNGLKRTNDNLGHEAGDELLKGAAQCIKKCFEPYGKVFRIGGDEFCALIYADANTLETIKALFNEVTAKWKGNLVKQLSVSSGYVTKAEVPDSSIHEMASLADKRMYQAKAEFYKSKGIDRRRR